MICIERNNMSQPKKKVVVTTGNKTKGTESNQPKGKGRPKSKAKVTPKTKKEEKASGEMVFGRKNYILMGVGVAAIFIGLLLMTGGAMEDPNEWEPERIYSFRRTVLAPIFILAGLSTEIFAIFRR